METLKFIDDTNAKNLSYKLAINKFSDLSDDEFKQLYLSSAKLISSKSSFLKELDTRDFFDMYADDDEFPINNKKRGEFEGIDYSMFFGPAKDQGQCGSCWAFGAIGAIEGNYAKLTKKTENHVRFSEQQIVDCSPYTNGCKGSRTVDALRYVQESGVAYENSYSYLSGFTKIPGECQASKLTQNFILTGTKSCSTGRCTRQWVQSLLSEGPLVVMIDAGTKEFKSYSYGVLDNINCTDRNHFVVLVGLGYDPDYNMREYYEGRNSWGIDWGMRGHFKIFTNNPDTCYMESSVVLPIVKESNNPVPPLPDQSFKLFSECDFKGLTTSTNSSLLSLDFTPQSFLLNKYKEVKVFLGPRCSGTFYTVTKSVNCLNPFGIKEPVKSIYLVGEEDAYNQPPDNCIWAYDNYCLGGSRVEICSDIADLKTINFENRISSVRFGSGIKNVRFYANINFRSSYFTATKTRFSFLESSLDKNIESLKFNVE